MSPTTSSATSPSSNTTSWQPRANQLEAAAASLLDRHGRPRVLHPETRQPTAVPGHGVTTSILLAGMLAQWLLA